jgi:hypothetical protein
VPVASPSPSVAPAAPGASPAPSLSITSSTPQQ